MVAPCAHRRQDRGCRHFPIMLFLDTSISGLQWKPVMQLSDRIGRRLKLHDLHVLMAVVQAGSMSKAAQVLNTTQPAVSRSIADLEHTIGARPLDRSRQGIEPTVYGRALLDGGVAMFDDLRQAVTRIELPADPTVGESGSARTTPSCGGASGDMSPAPPEISRNLHSCDADIAERAAVSRLA